MGKGVEIDGKTFPEGVSELTACLYMFGQAVEKGRGVVITPEDRFRYLKRAIDLAFNCEGSIREVVWNPWTELILRELIGEWDGHNFLGLAGCSSSGKSDTVALYGLMCYWSRPSDTYFIVMSTTKLSARGRIWKSVTQFWNQAVEKGCPGKLIDSDGYIKGVNQHGTLTRNSGIILMAAGQKDAATACKEIQGLKNPNFLVAADEFEYLGEGILKTSYQNLTANDKLTFCGMSNPDKISSPFGELCMPKDGWKSVREDEDYKWVTKYGKCVRLNAEMSPRITEEDGEKYFWQPDQEYCDRVAEDHGGKKSRGYYQFIKAFWCPDGASNSIYSETEMMNGSALDEREPRWDENPVMLSALDPAFSRGGDRSCAAFAKMGKVSGRTHLHFCHFATLSEDSQNKQVSLSHQIARQWKTMCEEWGVRPLNAALDNTGSGIAFGHIVDMEWSPAVSKVNFQAKPSDRLVVFRGQDCSYFNKNSELWIQPKEFIRENQVSGLTKEVMAEMVDREYHSKESKSLRVEAKEDAKKRLKRSPDLCDAMLMVVNRALDLGQLKSEEVRKVSKMANNGWQKMRKKRVLTTTCGRKFRR